MASVYQVTAVWSGFQGAPGYSKFAFSDTTTDVAANAAGDAVHDFFDAIKTYLSTAWTITFQPQVQEYQAETSTLVGEKTMSIVPPPVVGTAPSVAYAGGSGVCVAWKTNVIFAGRRVQGRTFVVPVMGAFEGDGTLGAAVISTFTAAGTALATTASADFSIWAKSWQKPATDPPTQTGGMVASVTSCLVKDIASGLRSRRT